MAKTNTEKPSGKAEQKKKIVAQPKKTSKKLEKTPVKKQEKEQEKTNQNKKIQESKTQEETKNKPKIEDKKTEKKESEKSKKKQVKKTTPKEKRDYAFVNGKNIPISTKDAVAICRFIKYKTPQQAINNLEDVLKLKKAVPMKGEIPHRKGKIMSGRFPKRACEHFIILLKSLQGNSIMHELEEPIINEAFANMANRPFGRFGLLKKRSNIKITATNKTALKNKKEKKSKK